MQTLQLRRWLWAVGRRGRDWRARWRFAPRRLASAVLGHDTGGMGKDAETGRRSAEGARAVNGRGSSR